MKRFRFRFVLFAALVSFSVLSCNFGPSGGDKKPSEQLKLTNVKVNYVLGESFETPYVYALIQDNYMDVTYECTFTGFETETVGKKTIHVSYNSLSTSYKITVSETEIKTKKEMITKSSITWGSRYETGNYFTDGVFEYYRAVEVEDYAFLLKTLENRNNVETLGGSVYNISPIKDMVSISINCAVTYYGDTMPRLYYGENHYLENIIEFRPNTSCQTFYLNNANYFRLDSGEADLYVEDVVIKYTGNNTPHGSEFKIRDANKDAYRVIPTVHSDDEYIAGETSVAIPAEIDIKTGKVISTKTYTYYPYTYVAEHPEYIEEATITDPVDVCNYFTIFGCAPANYGGNNITLKDGIRIHTAKQAKALFGNDARQISAYTRTDGYATSVPYNGTTPIYYELDIDVTGSYSVDKRQMGRIVAFATGFKGPEYDYGGHTVCLYTDDHYATFMEYNNLGEFMPRFNVTSSIVGAVWSNPDTILLNS